MLNAVDLKISNVKVTTEDGNTFNSKEVIYLPELEVAHFLFAKTLPVGTATLEMDFSGELNDKMKGFYRSKYLGGSEERYAAVTQFEATDARRCFPCWDEPAIKATFDIVLTISKDRVGLSNMPVIKEELLENNFKRLTFAKSPIMSTYCKLSSYLFHFDITYLYYTVVAVVVGEFDYVEGFDADGVQVRVYTPVGKKEQGLFALEVTTKVLPYYKDYFKIAYPLPKMDLVAISEFSAGAMENWVCNT